MATMSNESAEGTLPLLRRVPPRVWLLAAGLFVALLATLSYVEQATAAAACLERARFELIVCLGSPPDWLLPVLLAAVVGLSILIGLSLGHARPRGAS